MTATISQDHGALCIDTGGRKYFRRGKGSMAGDRGVVHRDDARRVLGMAAGRAHGTARRRSDLVGDAGRDVSISVRDGVSGDERRTEGSSGGQESGVETSRPAVRVVTRMQEEAERRDRQLV